MAEGKARDDRLETTTDFVVQTLAPPRCRGLNEDTTLAIGSRRLRIVFIVVCAAGTSNYPGHFATTERFCQGWHGHLWQDECPIDALCACHTFFPALRTITHHLLHHGFSIPPVPDYQMAHNVNPSWPRMSSNMENPFQNVPGPFIYALPDLRFSLSFGTSASRAHSTTGRPTPSLPPTPLEEQMACFPCDENAFDLDRCPNTTQSESEPMPQEGEAHSELDAKPQSDSRTRTPSPLSPTSSISSGQELTIEKTKRSRRRRRRNRQVVDVGGCVMGPRMVFLPLHVPHWCQSRTSSIIPPSPWSPGYPVVTAPGGDRWFKLQTGPGY